MRKQVYTVVSSSLALIALSGCLVMSGKSVDECGVTISNETLNQIVVGETSEAWLLATLGEPSDTTVVEGQEHTRVLRYTHIVTRSEGGVVLLIFAGGSDVRTRTTTYFEVVDGVVSRYWVEPSQA